MNKLSALGLSLVVVFSAARLGAESTGYEYRNERFNYSIVLPASWERSDLTLEEKHLLYAFPDRSTEIKLKAMRSSESDLDKIAGERWNLSGIDPNLNKIIETGRIGIRQNVTGKLLVFEYRSRAGTMLERTLITHNAGVLYILRCSSPTASFYRHEAAFNTAMATFRYIASGRNAVDEPPAGPTLEP